MKALEAMTWTEIKGDQNDYHNNRVQIFYQINTIPQRMLAHSFMNIQA